MITCPVCEHLQSVTESCAHCGALLQRQRAKETVSVAPMPDLETTAWKSEASTQPDVMPGFEPTRMESPPIPPVPEGLGIEVDLGRAGAVGEVPVGGLPELELYRPMDGDPKTVVPQGEISCRYCRRMGAQGTFCEGCGMKLPSIAKVIGLRETEIEKARCSACGARSARGAPCTDCGVLVPGAAG